MHRMTCLALCLLLVGCGTSDLAQQLAASRARRNAAIANEMMSGHISPAEAVDILDADHAYDVARDRARMLSAMPDAPMPVWHPTYPTPAQYSPPPVYAPPPSVADCCAVAHAPAQTSPRYIPYRAVAPLMPGINPDGTARN